MVQVSLERPIINTSMNLKGLLGPGSDPDRGRRKWHIGSRRCAGCGRQLVSSPDPDPQQLRVDYITATWTAVGNLGLGT